MRFFIRIQTDTASGQTWVLGDGRKSHSLDKDQVEALIAEAREGMWHVNAAAGQRLGQKLYRLLDGDGLLGDLRQTCTDRGETLALYLQLPEAWRDLPFEILWVGAFFTQAEDHQLIRQVTEKNRFKQVTLEKRPMSLLFMACSPENTAPVLDFEAEEEIITRTIEQEKLPLDISVEDSGSLEGLKTMLKALGPFDMLHLSGHAALGEKGPVFYMESETGEKAEVTPDQLWGSLANRHLKLLFLSGCETGKTNAQATTSFADAMVAKGIPMVIGWGLPVTDVGATRFATVLYKLLGEGLALDLAVNQARQAIADDYETWSLLRIFCDGTPLRPLADPPQKVVARPRREQTYRRLEQSQIKVLEYGFVGRRRQVQLGLRVLRGYVPDKNGLLITGTAGVGKSTLTGKLIERTAKKELIIFSGELEEGGVLAKLLGLFTRLGLAQVVEGLKADQPFEERIRDLFRDVFQKVPTLIVFDNFEQNLIHEDRHRLPAGPRRVLQPFLEGLSWAQGQTQIIITCRYPFSLMRDGGDLVASHLQHIPLMGLEGADLLKKRRLLEHMEASPHKQAFAKASGGNPRLMESLEAVAKHVTDLDPEALAKTLAEKSEDFVQKYLAEMLAAAQDETFQYFLAKASVYRTALPGQAYAAFGDETQLKKAVALTLMEREDRKEIPHYWVLPIIRDRFLAKLEDPKRAHAEAYRWYDAQITEAMWHVEERLECLHHGNLAFAMTACWQHAAAMTSYYHQMCLYREGVKRLQPLVQAVNEKTLTQDLESGDGYAVRFLNNLGALLDSQGDLAGAKPYYEQALGIRRKVLGEAHPDTAMSLNNLGYLLQVQGDLAGAKPYYEQALGIRRKVLGEAHPDTARSLNNLGGLLQAQGDLAGAKPYYEQALGIYRKVLGEAHPDTAQSLNNLGYLLQAQGDLAGAKPYFEQALGIRRKVLGEAHPDTAISLNNLGYLLQAQGDLAGAKPYYEQALTNFQMALGEEHPNSKTVRENLAVLVSEMSEDQAGPSQASAEPEPTRQEPDTLAEKTLGIIGASKSFSVGLSGDTSLLDVESVLSLNSSQLDPDQTLVQEKLQEALPEMEGRILKAFCPESDFRFPWDTGKTMRSERNVKGELGEPAPDEKTVRVFFATHRECSGSEHPEKIFGSKRSELRYGTCLVSIPPDHKTGELARPSALRLQFKPDPDHHMMILDVNLQTADVFFESVRARMAEDSAKMAFIFVHGYNVTFTEAALRTAQMAHDLSFKGAPVCYSWPSKGKILGYGHDEASIRWATPLLKDFLKDFLINTEADHVVLIGHSMGNRGLTQAVIDLVEENPSLGPKLKEIILAAPDIDADVFKRDILPPMVDINRSLTMYTCATDFALRCSKMFHGYPRAGHNKDGMIIAPGMETIDATHFATGILRHSYISKSRDVIYDIAYMIRHSHRADERPMLKPHDTATGRYWEFKP